MSEGNGLELRDVRIVEVTHGPAEAWDASAVHSPRGEAFQGHAWGEFKAGQGWVVHRYRLEDADGPLAVLSVQERSIAAPVVRRLPGRASRSVTLEALAGRYVYGPTGPVLLRDGREAAAATLHALTRLARYRRSGMFILDPTWAIGSPEALAFAGAGFRSAARQVQVSLTGMEVPLHADEAAQRAQMKGNVRRNINRALNSGIHVARFDATTPWTILEPAIRESYEMLKGTGHRRGFFVRPEGYHVASTRALIESDAATLWIARLDERPVAHTLVLHCGRRALSFQAGEGELDTKRVPGNYLLQWTILRWAAERGFTTYDMGGVDTHFHPGLPRDPSHAMWNLFLWKSEWGAKPVELVGAQEYAPWPLLGASLRAGWRVSDRLRRGAVVSGAEGE